MLEFDGISQSIGNESDQAQFPLGNADRVMRELTSDVDPFRAEIAFNLFHVGAGAKADLWKGNIVNWSCNPGPEFRVNAAGGLYELNLPYPTHRISRTCWKQFKGAACPYSGHDSFRGSANMAWKSWLRRASAAGRGPGLATTRRPSLQRRQGLLPYAGPAGAHRSGTAKRLVLISAVTAGPDPETLQTASYGANRLGLVAGSFVFPDSGGVNEEYLRVISADAENQSFQAIVTKDQAAGKRIRPTIWPSLRRTPGRILRW